jgi:hypothetical protein
VSTVPITSSATVVAVRQGRARVAQLCRDASRLGKLEHEAQLWSGGAMLCWVNSTQQPESFAQLDLDAAELVLSYGHEPVTTS